jgi:hypothetical protein
MRYNEILNENLGNLTQLNVGSMINVLKQDSYSSRKTGSNINPDGTKFSRYDSQTINAESEIIDGGVIGTTVADLRKAYRKAEAATGREVQAFALYIQGTAVAFGKYDLHTLGGSSREGKIAYDMTAFKEVLMQDYEARQAAEPNSYRRGYIQKPNLSSAREEPPRSWDKGKVRKFTGALKSTGSLSGVLDDIEKLSKLVGAPITCKFVVQGLDTNKKRGERFTQKQITAGTEDLRTRLQRYKNAKKPTAADINEFLKMVLTHEGKIVRFGGRAYVMKGSSYEKLDPMELLKGASFSVRYQSADPGEYGSVEISYQFDVANNTIVPYKATWNERSEGDRHGSSQTAVLDAPMFTKNLLGVKKIDKAVIIPKLLTMLKSGQYQHGPVEQAISALRQMGEDWPEFAIIEKSMAAEKAKKAA